VSGVAEEVGGAGSIAAAPAPLSIPEVAWSRPMGLPAERLSRPRVAGLIDDGEWAGVPMGGLGTGSIGRSFRGDVSRWHLEVGRHAFAPVAADAFSVFVGRADGSSEAHVLACGWRPPELATWGFDLPVGAGTYHALFPRAWQVFSPAALGGLRLTSEQLSPVVAGDAERSALPVAAVEWRLENTTDAPLTVGLMLSWANPLGARPGEALPAGPCASVVRDADAVGIRFEDGGVGPAGLRGSFAIAAAAGDGIELTTRSAFEARFDHALWADFAADGRLEVEPEGVARSRPALAGEQLGGAVAATVTLAPGEARALRYSLGWDLPVTEFGGGRRWWKRYTRAWGRGGDRAWDLARHALAETPAWREAIEGWQRPVVDDVSLPAWYRGALFNELYFVVDGGTFWEAGEVDGPEPEPDDPGRFALLECLDYRFYDTVDVDFYASAAILELWPELERRGIRDLLETVPDGDDARVTVEASGVTAVRKLPWTVPHDVGGPDEDPFGRSNRYRYQDVNGWIDLAPKLALQAWRDVVVLGDGALVAKARPAVEAALRTLAERDRDGDGLPDHAGLPDQTYDTWPMHGPSAYGGLLWLGALRAAEELARADGDAHAASRWRDAYERGRTSFERRLWRDGYYAYDGGGAASSDSVMADQLAGQWYADVCGLGDLVDPTRIREALRTIHARNVVDFGDGLLGAVNGMRPDGTVDTSSEQSAEVWVGTTYALAALMLGRGLEAEAWETAAGAAKVTYERGLWFRTPEAYDRDGNYRASLYLRPLAIWAIEEARRRVARG
jgi:non-lysosomal glucosylceramidase